VSWAALKFVEANSMATQYAVLKMKGMEPEMFVVVGMDFGQGGLKESSLVMTEAEMRKHLKKSGMSPEEVETAIEAARQNPM
jgi:hypothetical protein